MVADSAAKDADTVRAYVQGFTDAGCDELIFFPSDPDPGQVDLLADAMRRCDRGSSGRCRAAPTARCADFSGPVPVQISTALESLACSEPCEPPPTWCAPPQSRNS